MFALHPCFSSMHLVWCLVLIVHLTESRIILEKSLNKGLSRFTILCTLLCMVGGEPITSVDVGGSAPRVGDAFPWVWVPDCMKREKAKWWARTHELLALSLTGGGTNSLRLWPLGLLPLSCTVIWNWVKINPFFPGSSAGDSSQQ